MKRRYFEAPNSPTSSTPSNEEKQDDLSPFSSNNHCTLFANCSSNGRKFPRTHGFSRNYQHASAGSEGEVTDGERLLANEMKMLSLNERESVMEDIHGIETSADIEEHPELMEEKFRQMETNVASIRKKDAYARAAFLAPHAVKNKALRLKLLRTAQWDATKAANMIVKYFQVKLNLFGEENFIRPIRWQDLSEDSRRSLTAGAILRHEAATTDIHQRSVLIFNFASFDHQTAQSILQSLWYVNATVPINSESSRKGLVTITNFIGAEGSQITMFLKALKEMKNWGFAQSLPLRMTSNHICFGDATLKPCISLVLLAVSQDLRLRTKFHFGSHLECTYELGTYGVPTNLMPLDNDDMPRQDIMNQHLKTIRGYEYELWKAYEDAKPTDLIYRPNPIDIVLGRGHPYQSFPGNINIMQFLDTQRPLYEKAPSKLEKTVLSTAFVMQIKHMGIRFLKRDETGNYWEEVSDIAARQKITMSMRNLSRK